MPARTAAEIAALLARADFLINEARDVAQASTESMGRARADDQGIPQAPSPSKRKRRPPSLRRTPLP